MTSIVQKKIKALLKKILLLHDYVNDILKYKKTVEITACFLHGFKLDS